MVFEKGLSAETADAIANVIFYKGDTAEILNRLAKEFKGAAPSKALGEIKLLFELLDAYGCDKNIKFDLTLARGLDYYTGVIFEVLIILFYGEKYVFLFLFLIKLRFVVVFAL